MMDVRGSLPLNYVQAHDYEAWIDFFKRKKDTIWPPRLTDGPQEPPPLTLQLPNSRPISDPPFVLPNIFIQMLASGRMSPQEVALLQDDDDDDEDEDDDDEDEDDCNDEGYDFAKMGNESISRGSCGGYTFDFSKSSESEESSTSSSYSSLQSDDDDNDDDDAEEDAANDLDAEEDAAIDLDADAVLAPNEMHPSDQVLDDVSTSSHHDEWKPLPEILIDSSSMAVQSEIDSYQTRKILSEENRPALTACTSGTTSSLLSLTPSIPQETDPQPKLPGSVMTSAMNSDSFMEVVVLPNGLTTTKYSSPHKGGTKTLLRTSSTLILQQQQQQQGKSFRAKYCLPEFDDGLLAGSC
jgi:hypothetical protein